MPSIAKSTHWFVRITGTHQFLEEKVKILSEQIDVKRILSFLHKGDTKENPHCHFTIELTSVLQKQSFDARMKKLFLWEKACLYSSKVWDTKDEANSYMYHEDTEPIVNKGYTIEQVQKFKELNISYQKVIELNKGKASTRFASKIEAKCNDDTTKEDIAEMFLEAIRMGEMYHPGNFRLKSMIAEVYIKTRDKEQWKELKHYLISDLVKDI